MFKTLVARDRAALLNPIVKPQPNKFQSIQDFWHSSSHLLGWALETRYGKNCLLTDGPATQDGFFYDAFIFNGGDAWTRNRKEQLQREGLSSLVTPSQIQSDIKELLSGKHGEPIFPKTEDLKDLQKLMLKLASQRVPFERRAISTEEAQRLFIESPFKLALISRISKEQEITIFKSGAFVDLCRGPHIENTSQIGAVLLNKTSAAQWSPTSPQNLSRIYGISFENKEKMKEYKTLLVDAENRNHRKIGKAQSLFTFHAHSPGSPFFLPHGTRIIQKLKDYLRSEYYRFGFQEVVTPLIFNQKLWETSGHWDNYRDDMFIVDPSTKHECQDLNNDNDDGLLGLKPMNCPGHCLLFGDSSKSYRDLPLRFAEFSPLHRNEASGALTGLTRVRKFHQDDGHIFCTTQQLGAEIAQSLEFINRVYKVLGFPKFQLSLSTRPNNYIGNLEEWEAAEKSLKSALDSTGRSWSIKTGDGAFYGPKIDIMITDALGRAHQTATIQLDFQLPQRFGLKYADAEGGWSRPILIHRAVLGSLERMLGILIENYAGKWPFWLSPRQAMIVITRPDLKEKALELQKRLTVDSRFFIDVDLSDNTLPKQIRSAQILAYNYTLILGDREVENNTISVRERDGKDQGEMEIDSVLELFKNLNHPT